MRHLVFLWAIGLAAPALADAPVILKATVTRDGLATVTLSHPDSGWDHYADGWEVRTLEGRSLGLRVLAHPHVQEQPFTRSLSGLVIPAEVTQVVIRARCNRDGWSEDSVTVPVN